MSNETTVTLAAADAIELAELLEFLDDWLHSPGGATSYRRFTFEMHTVSELHADLARFTFLLNGHASPER